jgi:hypothetical protein
MVIARCRLSKKPFIINFKEEEAGVWVGTTGMVISEGRTTGNPNLRVSIADIKHMDISGFRCPLCETHCIFKCRRCERVTCLHDNWKDGDYVVCGWCENGGPLSGSITSLGGVKDL